MLQNVTITDGRTVVLDLEPMSVQQQTMMATAVADLLIRSGQIRDDVALSGPHLLQFLSEAADMAAEQAKPIDPADVDVFSASRLTHASAGHDSVLCVPGDLLVMRELDGSFDEGCDAIRYVNQSVADDHELAQAIAVLMNRAHWLGQGRCAPKHVAPRG